MSTDQSAVHAHPVIQDRYNDLLAAPDAAPNDYLVAISGETGVGTSSHARQLSDELGLDYINGGDLFRAVAKEHGYGDDIRTFEQDQERIEDELGIDYDVEVDRKLLEYAFSGEPAVIEGRLACAFLSADRGDGNPIAPVRIKLTCTDDMAREGRYAMREGFTDATTVNTVEETARETARNEIAARDEDIYGRYMDKYGIDPRENRFFNETVDNTATFDAVQDELRAAVERHAPFTE